MTHRRACHRALRAAAPLLVLLAAVVPTAQAADWTPPIQIGSAASEPVAALSGSGNAVAAWYSDKAVATYRSRTTAAWGAPFVSSESVSSRPSVAAGNNSAVVAYESAGDIYAVVYESGAWQSALTFGAGSTPQVGMDASGDALLVWLDATGTVVQAVRPAGSSWTGGAAMSLPGADDLDLAVNASGAAIASWRVALTGANAALGSTGAGFLGTGSAIDPTATATTDVDAAIGADGTAVVVWADAGAIRAGYRANGGGGDFDVATVVAGPADSPAVAVDSNGLALVGWRTGGANVQWASSTTGAWSGTGATLGAGAAAGSVVAAANGAGADLALGWVSGAARTAVRPAGGSWGTALHDSGSTVSVAVDTAGDVLSVWQGASGARTATWDSSAPTLGINVPGTAVAGQSVGMSATAADLWSSSVNDPSWDFGDGSPDGSGFNVQHSWSTTGTKTVTANMTDAAGNAAAPATDTISITAAAPTNSGAPGISGAQYRDGVQLSASNGSWTGAPTSFDHQWQRCGTGCDTIASAVNATYTPTAADVGLSLRVLVTASNGGGTSAPAVSAGTPVIAPQSTDEPALSGTARDGQTLTASSPASDWNGVSGVSLAYQWKRCNSGGGGCVLQGGYSASSTYTLGPADVGSRIVVQAVGSVGTSAQTVSADSTPSGVVAPIATAAPPTPSGTAQDGSTLTASASGSQFNNAGGLTFTYQWRRCDGSCADIGGATGQTYQLQAADVGAHIAVQIDATSNGSAAASGPDSATTVAIAPRNTALPVVSGPLLLDAQTLTTTNGSWNGLNEGTTPALTFTRQWQRCNSSGGSCTDIAGATGSSYTLDAGDVGSRIRSIVTASRNGAAISAAASVTGVIAPLNTAGPAIGGAAGASDGVTLSVAAGNSSNAWGDAGGLSYTYEWKRCDQNGNGCSSVVGTNATYTPGAADVGLRLRLAVTAHINGASTTSADSAAATDKIAPRNTALPTVGGSAVDGQTLSAGQGNWNGATGLQFTYQWRRCDPAGLNCANIGGNPTVTLGPADVGMQHGVVVSASKNGSAADSADSGLTGILVAPLATGPSTIAGSAQDAGTLSATPGNFNGVGGLGYRYQWQRCVPGCSDIAGATAASYSPVAADVGNTIKVSVDAQKNGSNWTDGQLSGASAVIAPRETAVPLLTGQPKDGTAMGTDGGDWNGVTGLTRTYQWQRCDAQGAGCANISAAATVTPPAADVGTTYRVLVSASKGGSAVVAGGFSAASGVIAPLGTAAPGLTLGAPRDGTVASTGDGSWNGATGLTFARQWRRCDTAGANCADIPGATGATYVLQPADVGTTVRALVTASKNGGNASQVSPPSAIIAPLNTGAATVAGTAKDGSTLSAATTGTWNGATALLITYQWKRCDAAGTTCTTQVGTGATYTPVAADVGFPLKLAVSASKNGSVATAAPDSASSGVIAARNTQAPAAAGTATDGQTLTASGATAAAWNNAAGLTLTQEWLRCAYPGWATCTAIAGQTGTTYLLTPSDIDAKIKVRVTAAKNGVSTVAESAASAVVAPRIPAPDLNSRPFLTNSGAGPLRIGHTAFANPGGWNTGALNFTFSWRSCPTPQHPAACPEVGTGTQFSIPATLVDRWLSILVTAQTSNLVPPQLTSTTAAYSVGLQIADNSLSILELPVISGSPVDGSTLTTTDPAWDPAHNNNEYHWQRCATTDWPGSCDAIPGASGSSYTLTPSDVGKYVTIRIRGSFPPDFADAWPEFTTAIVTARVPRNTSAPTLSGSATIGSVLTAAPGAWDGTPTIAFAYQWLRCDAAGLACTFIAGSTGASYTVTAADATHTLRARVTASNGGGVSSADSGASAGVPTPPAPGDTTTTPPTAVTPPPATTPPPVVAKKDRKAPVMQLKLAAGANLRSGAPLLVKVTCPKGEKSCTGSVELRGDVLGPAKAFRRGVKVATARFKLKGGKFTTVRLVLAAPAQRTLNSLGRLRAELRATAVDAAGNKGLGKARVTLVRPRNTTFGKSSGA